VYLVELLTNSAPTIGVTLKCGVAIIGQGAWKWRPSIDHIRFTIGLYPHHFWVITPETDFARWLHRAMWHVALRSWQWIHQVAAPCNVIRGYGMSCHWIRPIVRHIGILHLVSISTISPVCEILSKSDHPWQKKMTSCRFSRWLISAILDFSCPIMGSLKSPCTTFYRSPIETIALNCLVFEKMRFLHFGERQTNRQTNRWTASMH